MRWYHLVIMGLGACAAAVILASCAYSPRVADESATVLSIRADYLRSNPGGRYNEYINRGEVVKGMNYVEVLASWGFPQSRLRLSERDFEYWRYVARDDATGDWIQYTFVFEGPALFEWESTRHTTKGRAMAEVDFRGPVDLPGDAMYPPETSAAVKR
jgi:hypothetical protein